jgi:nitroimidazol reductase NimA-like FMN-containing flavoprotein (pyridoxamine 5'-phosphate oxidase superfamily)
MRQNEKETKDFRIIEKIIRKSDVCRLAIANDNIPYVVTMNFGYRDLPDKTLYFHCANSGRKLDMIRKNNYVCFEMDTDHQIFKGPRGCDWGMKFSSVVGYGNISIVSEKGARETGLNCIMSHYGGEEDYEYDEDIVERTTILKLDITEITGKMC